MLFKIEFSLQCMQFGINKNVSLVYLKFSYSYWVYFTVAILGVTIMDHICVDFMCFFLKY